FDYIDSLRKKAISLSFIRYSFLLILLSFIDAFDSHQDVGITGAVEILTNAHQQSFFLFIMLNLSPVLRKQTIDLADSVAKITDCRVARGEKSVWLYLAIAKKSCDS